MGFNKLFKRKKIYNIVVYKEFQYMTNSIIVTDYLNNKKIAVYNKEIERIEKEYGETNNDCKSIYSCSDSNCNRIDSFCNINDYKNR